MSTTELPQPDLSVDASGRFCPIPILELAKAARQAQSSQVIELVATDPGVETDVPAWCKATRNEYLGMVREDRVLKAYVRKR